MRSLPTLTAASLPAAVLLAMPVASLAADSAPPTSTGGMLQLMFGLVVVLGLLAGAAWLARRVGPVRQKAAGNIRIVGGVSVGTRERVLVVEVADQWIVVGVAPGNITSLATMPRQETLSAQTETGPDGQPLPPFAAWLKKTIEKRNNGQ
jgi:flagellar protein FliO/FliZ